VFIKKLIEIPKAPIAPYKKLPSMNNKHLDAEIRKQKLNKRGNIYRRNFLEFSPSSVLNTVGDVTTIKEIITPSRSAFINRPNSTSITYS
tara:strand:- start:243 stop:512 length:270 start_codon:yes stop_codon:yes gene_type:complete